MTAEDQDDDFARFRAERLAKRRPTRPSPSSGIPFFGTDRKARTQIRNLEGQERVSLDSLDLLKGPGLESPEETKTPAAAREVRTPRPAPASPRPRPKAPRARTQRSAPRSPAGGKPRPAVSSPPRGAPRRGSAAPGAAAPLAGAPAGRPAPRACPPTAVERPRRPGLVIDPPQPRRRPAPVAERVSRPAPGSRDRRSELPLGSAEPMEQVVQMTRRAAERAERKVRFRKQNQPEDLAPEKQRVYRQYSTSRRLRRAARQQSGRQSSQSG
jgi:hypothetical protein